MPAPGSAGTLVDVLDHTKTAMGGRALRDWILRPLVEMARVILDAAGEAHLTDHLHVVIDALFQALCFQQLLFEVCQPDPKGE